MNSFNLQRGFSMMVVLLPLLVIALVVAVVMMQPDRDQSDTEANGGSNATTQTGNSFAVRGVQVFDGRQVLPDQTVIVADGLITGVGQELQIPEGMQTIDGQGKTLLPGLIDSHVHTFGNSREDSLRFGVTTAVDLFTDHRQLAEFREQRETISAQVQADIYSAGTLVTASGGHGTQFGRAIPTLDDAEDAEAFIQARVSEGSDFIKLVYEDGSQYGGDLPTLNQATLQAAITAAKNRGLLTIVHVSTLEHGKQALRAGADGLAHMFSDQPADDEFIQLALEQQAFVVPTLAVLAGVSGRGDVERWLQQPALDSLLNGMQKDSLNRSFPIQDESLINNSLSSVARLQAAGVTLLAGSDAPNPGTAHGIGLHQELWWLVQAGLTPAQVLQAATADVASVFSLSDRGRIQTGLRADMVLIDGDPLQSIDDSLSINTVWKDGFQVGRGTSEQPETATTEWRGGLLADFETPVDLAMRWQVTTDQIMNGQSEAAIDQRQDSLNAGNGVLHVSGMIKPGSMFPWAGVITFVAEQPMQPVNADGVVRLKFRARGMPGTYQLMVFSGPQANGMPVMQAIDLTDTWQTFDFDLAEMGGVDLSLLRAFAWTAGTGLSDFEFELDDVEVR